VLACGRRRCMNDATNAAAPWRDPMTIQSVHMNFKSWANALPPFGPRPGAPDQRLHVLDGLRGWAALSVVAFHIFWETFGVIAPSFRNIATGFFLNGSLAVSMFFVLSGEALSTAYFSGKGDAAIHRLAIKRYPRLVIPILAVCLIVYAAGQAGLTYNVPAGDIVGRPEWLGAWLKTPPDLAGVLAYAFGHVFVPTPPPQAVNPFLHTMVLELPISFVVLFLLLTMKYLTSPRLMLAVYFAVLVVPPNARNVACFIAGMIFADIRWSGGFAALQKSRLNWLTWVVIVTLALVDGYLGFAGIYHQYTPVLAIVLLAAVFCNPQLVAFFSTPLSLWLGRISFPLFLVQFPVLVTFGSWAIVAAHRAGMLDHTMVWLIALATLGASIIAAVLFEPVETFTRWFGNQLVGAVYRAGRSLSAGETTVAAPPKRG
jgi:peptidoglycan/LPS O-acetylase OafA/YrhL